MKILLRLIMICALLSGLTYGSYAFGRFVLSTKLFAGSIAANPRSVLAGTSAQRVGGSVGRTNYKGGAPRVQIDVLPAEATGPGPEPPAPDAMERQLESGGSSRIATTRRATPPSSTKRGSSGSRAFDKESALAGLSDGTTSGYDADGNPMRGGRYSRSGRYNRSERSSRYARDDTRSQDRPRRPRRRRSSSRATTSDASSNGAGASTGSVSDDGSFSNGDAAPSRTESSDSGSSRSPAPRMERRPRRTESVERPARSTRSERHESPVPRPEGNSGGSSGGDSPVPQPE